MIMPAHKDKNDISIESVSGKVLTDGLPPELTARQQQILDLMQAGKVNKEIANKLGIGVGTVKQHIVALFKKLNVSNRTMAVSRGMVLQQGHDSRNAALTAADGTMERRPCVVLSIALPEGAVTQAVRMLHGIMAALAFDNDALFLARKGNAGDIIFGIQRVTEYDLIKALHTAQAVFYELLSLDNSLANDLRGGLTSGLAGASMNRFGGWTGEAVASAAIAAARDLVEEAAPGHLALGRPARDMMQAFGIGSHQGIPDVLAFSVLDSLRWTGERNTYGLIGRRAEMTLLEEALDKVKHASARSTKKVLTNLICLEGETGMGKSRLCKEISESCLRQGGKVLFFRCLPLAASNDDLLDTLEGRAYSIDEVVKLLDTPLTQLPDLLIIDDFHIPQKEKQLVLFEAAKREAEKGRMVILSGRRNAQDVSGQSVILLRRLPMSIIEELVRQALGERADRMTSSGILSIAQVAAGVPLFAVEMARHAEDEMLALPLLVVISARLDNLRLDRELLRCVARIDERLTLVKAAELMGEEAKILRQSLENAVAAGVLDQDAEGILSFTHPLLRQVIDFLAME